jgi:hypothetical protein
MRKKEKKVRLARYIRPYLLYAALSPLLMILEVMADLCLPVLMSYIVDYGINAKGDITEAPLAASLMRFFAGDGYSHTDIILTFGLLMLGITLLGGFFGTLCAYTAARAAQNFSAANHGISSSVSSKTAPSPNTPIIPSAITYQQPSISPRAFGKGVGAGGGEKLFFTRKKAETSTSVHCLPRPPFVPPQPCAEADPLFKKSGVFC